MASRETVRMMTDGQKSDIIATMVGVIPSLTFEEAQRIIGNKGPFVAEIRAVFDRRKQHAATELPTYPADGEIFELTLDGAAHDPIEMVRRDRYDEPEQWKFTGKRIAGMETRRFKLVSIGHSDFIEVRSRLKQRGWIPEGQWREALKAAYRSDGERKVGIADASWVDERGHANFPYINTFGISFFTSTGGGFSDYWRWLVEVPSK